MEKIFIRCVGGELVSTALTRKMSKMPRHCGKCALRGQMTVALENGSVVGPREACLANGDTLDQDYLYKGVVGRLFTRKKRPNSCPLTEVDARK